MANYEHLLLLKQGVSQWNEWRRKHLHTPIDLVRADLRGVRLRWVDLRDADLSGADLSQASLQGADLRWANLARANLSQADLQGAMLSFANLEAANLNQANFRAADLRAAQLQAADLETADLSGAILSESDLSSAELRRLELPSTNLSESELSTTMTGSHNAVPTPRVTPDALDLTLEQFGALQDSPLEAETLDKTTLSQDDTFHDWSPAPADVNQNGAAAGESAPDPVLEFNTLEDWIQSYSEG